MALSPDLLLFGCFYGAASSVCSPFTASLSREGAERASITAKGCQGQSRSRAGLAGGISSQGMGRGSAGTARGWQLPPKLCPAPGTRGHSLGSDRLPVSSSPDSMIKSRRGLKPALKTCLTSARPEGQLCARALSPHQGHDPLSYSATLTC